MEFEIKHSGNEVIDRWLKLYESLKKHVFAGVIGIDLPIKLHGRLCALIKRMSSKEDIQITAADQGRINSFATHNLKLKEYEAELENKKNIIKNLNDLEDELLLSEAEYHPFKIGESFFHLSTEETNEKVAEQKETLKDRLVKLESDLGDCKAVMSALKRELYAKFGDNINLEDS